jgi:hypothetical protein
LLLLGEAFVGGVVYGQAVLQNDEPNLQKMKKDTPKKL